MTVEDKFKNAVLTEDGELEKFIRVDGKLFRCRCGSNCFHKPDKNDLELHVMLAILGITQRLK